MEGGSQPAERFRLVEIVEGDFVGVGEVGMNQDPLDVGGDQEG